LKLQAARNGNGATLTFNAASNKTYSVLMRERLEDSPWQRLADFVAAPTNRVITHTPPPGQNERYFRLVTPLQP
jgi:hypothetical protein